ncbi:uncharacterized protein LOC107790327 [Nicotiana tabacum]|uniref:Uncharacterized protein LOC107790327 n=2 Tax=Nicotiana TaxID=4085 RepID=A0A1S3ZTN5_TOBAC|nr:PREDICTED: uncharacterized protein LOC104237913 [Nicotiana sylvestris]XP_016467732.1 PREDICTED: uncharacterized protein LOC107790327 [Nicotiana tabacum]
MAAVERRPPEPDAADADDNSIHVSLIDAIQNFTDLDISLNKLERFLRVLGFCQYSILSTGLSWLAFFVISIIVPLLVDFSYCSNCERYKIDHFELEVLVSQSIAAATSLLCISHNLRKYRIRKLLFVDRYHGQLTQFSALYLKKIRAFYYLVVSWMTICFLLKITREVTRAVYLYNGSVLWSIGIVVASLVSWAYSTIIFLVGTALFHLVGNLQIIHFEHFGELLEMDMDVSVYINEHMRLTYYLCKISHRFRMFLLLEYLIITASQCTVLLQTTTNRGIINFINAGDFAVLSIVQLLGLVICLNAAAKISHRAQGLGSVASRWHALVTCNNNDTSVSGLPSDGKNGETPTTVSQLPVNYSEGDLESADCMPPPTNIQLTSTMSPYHKRQAFVAYVQSNHGGFSIFGWMVDRLLINTLFFVEMTLVTFLLGMTLTIKVR